VHEAERSFPLWYNDVTETLTNLLGSGQPVWTATQITLEPTGIQFKKHPALGQLRSGSLTLEQGLDAIEQNLRTKFVALAQDYANLPKKLFVSGGIDTALILALSRQHRVVHDVVDYEHFEYDAFTNANWEDIRARHWGYGQIHHWRSPTMLLTGACGDEFLLRGPNTLATWCAWQDIDIVDILAKSTGYHVGYFNKPKNLKIFQDAYSNRHEIRDRYPTYMHLVRQILDANINDYQYWHLGNTLTHTPFKDIELTKIMLQLPIDELIKHIIDASICKQIIGRINPEYLALVAPTKNLNSRRNLPLIF
jgi:hypothetical protein